MKVVYDKYNNRVVDFEWFFDQDGNCWIDQDRYGIKMDGSITIKRLSEYHPQYEVRIIDVK